MLRATRPLVVALGFVALSLAPAAQCPTPDLLDGGPCCAPAQALLPPLPSFNQSALSICWRDCDIDLLDVCVANWQNILTYGSLGSPCKPRPARLRLIGGGIVKWDGRLLLQYARTWVETDTSGNTLQVYRYLVNGDMRPDPALGPPPCPTPPCAVAFNGAVRFTGYIDFVENCSTGAVSKAWMLTHACDRIDHFPGFARGGVFHPNHAYTFVGPAASFLPGPIQPIEGGVGLAESVRRVRLPVPGTAWTCEFEEPTSTHLLSPSTQVCFCNTASPMLQFAIQTLFLGGGCGTTLTTPGGPFLPGFLSMGIGSWVNPSVYPGLETLRWNAGGYDDTDPCSGITQPKVFFGVSTLGGFPANQLTIGGIGPPLAPTFVDQSSSVGGAVGVQMNVPYVSDEFIALNH